MKPVTACQTAHNRESKNAAIHRRYPSRVQGIVRAVVGGTIVRLTQLCGQCPFRGIVAQRDAGIHAGGGCAVQAGFWGRREAINAPVLAVVPHGITKYRYLVFDPSSNVGQRIVLRVTRVGSFAPWYVGCVLQDAGVDGKLSALVPTAEFCEWTDSVIHVRGCEIVPGNEYLVEATADDISFSSTLSILTTAPQISASRQFGDVVGSDNRITFDIATQRDVWELPRSCLTRLVR